MVKPAVRNRRRQPQQRQRQAPRAPQVRRAAAPGLDEHAKKYLAMLANPCSGPIVTPLYPGTPGAYQVRLNKSVQPSLPVDISGTPGQHVKLDLVACYVPGLNVYKFWWQFAGTPTNIGSQFQAYDFFDPANDLIDTYRPIAACTKINPCGDYSTRSGIIGLVPEQGCTYPNSGGETAASSMAKALRRDPFGECVHEFVWTPAETDTGVTNVTTPVYSDNSHKACMTTVMCNIDAIYTTTTEVSVQAYLEFTGVYEWNPDYTKYGKDLSTQLPAVSRTPLNTALHHLGNVGNFCVRGFNQVAGFVGNRGKMQLLSAGVSALRGSAPRSMLAIAN